MKIQLQESHDLLNQACVVFSVLSLIFFFPFSFFFLICNSRRQSPSDVATSQHNDTGTSRRWATELSDLNVATFERREVGAGLSNLLLQASKCLHFHLQCIRS